MPIPKIRYTFKEPNGHILQYIIDIQHLEKGDMLGYLDSHAIEIERDLIGRDVCTGFKDSIGRDIYEGDIMFPSKSSTLPAVVYYDARVGQFRMKVDNNLQYDKTYDLSISASRQPIIGNVHINPELLKEERR